MGHLDCVSFSVVNLLVPIVETFVKSHANMRFSLAQSPRDVHPNLGPWDDVIESNSLDQLLHWLPELRAPNSSLVGCVIKSDYRSKCNEDAKLLLEVLWHHGGPNEHLRRSLRVTDVRRELF